VRDGGASGRSNGKELVLAMPSGPGEGREPEATCTRLSCIFGRKETVSLSGGDRMNRQRLLPALVLEPVEAGWTPEVRCAVCSQSLESAGRAAAAAGAAARICPRCEAPHHADCWDYNGGCAIFGCGSVPVAAGRAGVRAAARSFSAPPAIPGWLVRVIAVAVIVVHTLLLLAALA
jgi:hypothetical protein